MHATTSSAVPTIAILQIGFAVWAAYHIVSLTLFRDIHLSPVLTVPVFVYLAFAVIGGALLLGGRRAGVWVSIGVQGLQFYLFTTSKLSWGVILGPYFLVHLWPRIGVSFGYRFEVYQVLASSARPFSLMVNLVPAAMVAVLMTTIGSQQNKMLGDATA